MLQRRFCQFKSVWLLLILALQACGLNSELPVSPTPTRPPTSIPAADSSQPPPQKPLLVFSAAGPWGSGTGSGTPELALYTDGLLIFRQLTEQGVLEQVSVTLDHAELNLWLDSLAIGEWFDNLEDYYRLTNVTDQPMNTLRVWRGDQMKVVSIYGPLRSEPVEMPSPFQALATPTPLDATNTSTPRFPEPGQTRDFNFCNDPNPPTTCPPPALLDLLDRLISYTNPHAIPWRPDQIEVLIWPEESDTAIPWPAGWPDLHHPQTRPRDKISYSIFLDSVHWQEFKQLIQTGDEVVLMNGQTWAVSYRFPLPEEQLWQK